MGNSVGLKSVSERSRCEGEPNYYSGIDEVGGRREDDGEGDKAAVRSSEVLCLTDVLQDLFNGL